MLEALKEVVFYYENRFSKRQTFSGRNPAKFFSAGPEPEPENGAGYPAGTGLCRISCRFLTAPNQLYFESGSLELHVFTSH